MASPFACPSLSLPGWAKPPGMATLTYFLAPESVTHGHLGRSLYFSIVTFVTLGCGDISQTSSPLQLLSAIEAFCGMFLTGLVLAGFASKTKQY